MNAYRPYDLCPECRTRRKTPGFPRCKHCAARLKNALRKKKQGVSQK